MMMKQVLFSILFISSFGSFSQTPVELVVSIPQEYALASAFSNDNKMVAKVSSNLVSIWDVATGRMIRNTAYTDNNLASCNELSFSADNQFVILKKLNSNDVWEVDISSGKSVEKKGPAFDWSSYEYNVTDQQKASAHLYGKEGGDLKFPTPDGSAELILHKVKNDRSDGSLMPYIYEIKLKRGSKTTKAMDNTYFTHFAFSPDSKYIFANTSVYDATTLKLVSRMNNAPFKGYHCSFLPETRLPVSCGVETLRIWDFPEVVDIGISKLVGYKQTQSGRYLVCEQLNDNKSKTYSLVDIVERKILSTVTAKNFTGYITDVSPDGERFIYYTQKMKADGYTMTYKSFVAETRTGKTIAEIPNTISCRFTDDPNVVYADSIYTATCKYNLKTKKRENFPTVGIESATHPRDVSADHRHIYGYDVLMEDSTYYMMIKVWNFASGDLVFNKKIKGASSLSFAISKNDKYMAVSSGYKNTIFLFDFKSGELLYEFTGHTGYVMSLAFSDDNTRLISGSVDGSSRLWNLETGTPMVTLISTGKKDFAIVNSKKYYYATKGAQKFIHFVKGKEIFPFEQFDLKYNRPDLILESLQASNIELIRPYNLAYQKRLRRLGFTEEMLDGEFHLPKVNITNKNDLPLISADREINLTVHAIDSKYSLDRVLIRVNGVPLHGKMGFSLRGQKKQLLKEDFSLKLSNGVNRIAVSVMNEKGVESIASVADVEYNSPDSKLPDLHLVTLGVSKYADPQFDLNYAAKDAMDLSNLYVNQHLPFSRVHSYHLENTDVTSEKLDEIKSKLAMSGEDDVVCLFFAGHGLLDEELNYFLAAYDVNFQNPSEGGIPYDIFEELVDGIPARKKLVMIDACHSGEIDKDEVAWAENTDAADSGSTDEDIEFRAVTTTGFKQVGLENSYELMKELFTDIRKSSGALIISSAGGTEYAMEGSDWNNGVFTYSLLNGMSNGDADLDKDGKVMAGELNEFVRIKVSELTGGRQTPTTRAEVLENDWRMW